MPKHVLNRLDELVAAEWKRHPNASDANALGAPVGQVIEGYQFVRMAFARYEVSAAAFMTALTRLHDSIAGKSGSATPEQARLMEQRRMSSVTNQYEMQCFFLFSALLLDKIARLVLFYFGQAKGVSLNSHHSFLKQQTTYATRKELLVPDGLAAAQQQLQGKIVDVRDKLVTHVNNPRAAHATTFNIKKAGTGFGVTHIHPKPSDEWRQADPPDDLMPLIDQYLLLVVDLLTVNADRRHIPQR